MDDIEGTELPVSPLLDKTVAFLKLLCYLNMKEANEITYGQVHDWIWQLKRKKKRHG